MIDKLPHCLQKYLFEFVDKQTLTIMAQLNKYWAGRIAVIWPDKVQYLADRVRRIFMAANNLKTIPEYIFDACNMPELIDKIPDITSMFCCEKIPEAVKFNYIIKLDITGQQYIRQEHLDNFYKLRIVIAGSTIIKSMTYFGENLQKIILNNCKITTIDISRFPNLKQANFSYNSLKEFKCSPVLEVLHISYNPLESITLGKKISKLFINNTSLTYIDWGEIKFRKLNISYTGIKSLPHSVEKLNISRSCVPIEILTHIHGLRLIEMYGYWKIPKNLCSIQTLETIMPPKIDVVYDCCARFFPGRQKFYISLRKFFAEDYEKFKREYQGYTADYEKNKTISGFKEFIKVRRNNYCF